MTGDHSYFLSLLLTTLLLAVLVLASLSIGPSSYGLGEVIRVLLGAGGTGREVIVGIRLPRTLAAVTVGASLGVGGLIVQSLTRNPLADPYLLGISSGALVATGLLILIVPLEMSFSRVLFVASGFTGGILAFALTLIIAEAAGGSASALILAGIAVSSFLSGLTLALSLLIQAKLGGFIVWLAGSLEPITMHDLEILVPLALIGLAASYMISDRLDLMLMGDEISVHGGVDPHMLRRLASLMVAFLTALAVSMSGIIGFIGLVVPHISRMLVGPLHRRSIPLSAIIGASILLGADIVSRMLGEVIIYGELPVGAITSMIGAPFFLYLLVARRGYHAA